MWDLKHEMWYPDSGYSRSWSKARWKARRLNKYGDPDEDVQEKIRKIRAAVWEEFLEAAEEEAVDVQGWRVRMKKGVLVKRRM